MQTMMIASSVAHSIAAKMVRDVITCRDLGCVVWLSPIHMYEHESLLFSHIMYFR
jgi:hypothetical protein